MEHFWSWGIGSLPLCTLPLRFRVILVDPCFITCDDAAQMSSYLSKRSWQIVTLLCFCSSMSSFGTISAHTFLMSNSSVKIFLTVSLTMFTCSAMLLTVSRRFSRTKWRTFCNVFFSSARCWPSWSLFVGDTFFSPRITFHPLVNCRFLHSIIPVNLQ